MPTGRTSECAFDSLSVAGEAPQQRERLDQGLLLVCRELGGDRLGEPAFTPAAVLLQPLAPVRRQLDEDAASVVLVRMALDQAGALELRERLRHRLRPDALGGGELARRQRAFAVEAAEHARLADRERVLATEPADELPEHDAELARRADDLRGPGREDIVDR